jgi:U32 family peptidase
MAEPLPFPKPEVMSPAGYWPELHAAVEAGADAVYFGLSHFTARAKVGFALEELPEALAVLHRRGVRGYVTFNTLVFDSELLQAAHTLAAIAEAGADAIIVQDLGVAELAARIAPDLEVHGSTQMSLSSAEGIRLAQSFGVRRVVLARELALDEIRAIRAQTDCELEMFVHGALCVSYSGQCFSSEAWGGRSANRGQCAQACRLPYELLVDERLTPLGDARYLLSPGDLMTLEHVPEIVRLGVSALKIEGRYKDATYVALTTRAYRRAVDEACSGAARGVGALERLRLEQVYSRGLGPHFVKGTDHQAVVRGRAPRHRGVLMARVVEVLADRVLVRPEPGTEPAPLKPGDGVVFDAADWRSPEQPEEGGRLYHVRQARGGLLELELGNGAVRFERIRPGDWLWRTDDPELDRLARPYTKPGAPISRQPVRLRVTAREGGDLRVECELLAHPELRVAVQAGEALGSAVNRPLSAAFVSEQLGRLGGTPYELADLRLEVEGQPFVPASVLNRLRREMVQKLALMQAAPPRREVRGAAEQLQAALSARAKRPGGRPARPRLHVMVREPAQLGAALAARPESITLDYLDLYGLGPAIERVQAAGIEARVASPRVLKPGEERVVRFLEGLGCPILVRSTGLLEALRGREHPPLYGDFSLNAANVLAARSFLGMGLERLTPTHDLNAAQVATLAREVGADLFELVAYQHLPVFHTEHCVFCRFLSAGTSYKDCGRPCESHRVALRDEHGRAHPVQADVGCRNTVFGAEAQEASAHLEAWLEEGVLHFRLEFVQEAPGDVTRVVEAFRDALGGRCSAAELGRRLRALAPQGTTEGSLFVPADELRLTLR